MSETYIKKRSSYLKDKKISLLKQGGIVGGWPSNDWLPVEGGENIWAYYRQASTDELFNSAATQYQIEAVFKIGWRDDVEEGMRILFRGKEYSITRIDDYEGYKQDLTIYASSVL